MKTKHTQFRFYKLLSQFLRQTFPIKNLTDNVQLFLQVTIAPTMSIATPFI